MDFPRPPKNHHPRQSIVLHPTCRPQACATMVLHHPCRLTAETGGSSIVAEQEGTTSTTISVVDQTQKQGHIRPLLATRPRRAREAPLSRCSNTAKTPAPPVSPPHLTSRELHRRAKTSQPAPTQMGPNGPRSGPRGRRQPPAPLHRPTANDHAAAPRTTQPLAGPKPLSQTIVGLPHSRRAGAPYPPPSARGKAVHRRRCHPGFA
jgi:hypothetical protein